MDRPGQEADGARELSGAGVVVRAAGASDRPWIATFLAGRWGGQVLLRGELIDAATLPALVADDRQGLVTWRVAPPLAEIVTLDAVEPGRGIGSALIAALARQLRKLGARELRVTTTNDNLDALRFYQRRGFRLLALRPGAVEAGRRLKPSIPREGAYGIAIRDELELALPLVAGSDSASSTPRPPAAATAAPRSPRRPSSGRRPPAPPRR
jgi:GNAT superfamily N-acetyltransferase